MPVTFDLAARSTRRLCGGCSRSPCRWPPIARRSGAAQASLEAESERLTVARSSLTSAGSRITDVNYAHAVTKKSAAQVQLHMATAVLAHKSVNPEAALYLTL